MLRRRSVCERRRLRSLGGFGRLCPFSGAEHPHRPVVQPTGRESVRVELIAAHYPALPGNERRPALCISLPFDRPTFGEWAYAASLFWSVANILALALPSGSVSFAPEPRRLWTSGPATRVRGRQPFLDQNVTNVPAVRFKRAAGAAEIAKPLAQRGCGARTYDRRVANPPARIRSRIRLAALSPRSRSALH